MSPVPKRIDIGERAQIGIGLVGAVALLVWLGRQTLTAEVTAVIIASVVLLVAAAAITAREMLTRE